MLVEFCQEKDLRVPNTWLKRENRKVIYRMGDNVTEIDIVLIRKEHKRFL